MLLREIAVILVGMYTLGGSSVPDGPAMPVVQSGAVERVADGATSEEPVCWADAAESEQDAASTEAEDEAVTSDTAEPLPLNIVKCCERKGLCYLLPECPEGFNKKDCPCPPVDDS